MINQIKILVIDDDDDIRSTISAILQEEGYLVDQAMSGAEAIKKTQSTSYNVALIDIKLPDMDGVELLTQMNIAAPQMRKIIVTGYPSEQNAIAALNQEADAYLLKPVDIEKLLDHIKKQLNKQEADRKFSELAASGARFRETLDNLMEGCQIISPEWRYLYVNEVAARQLRMPKESMLGSTVMEICPDVEKTRMFPELKKCMNDKEPITLEHEFVFPDGSKSIFELKIQPSPAGVVVLSEDITERRNMQKRLLELACQMNNLSFGLSYLCESHERFFKAYADLTFHGMPGLCIVREDPEKLVQSYGIKAKEIRLLSAKAFKDFEALTSLQTISLAISEFLNKNEAGVVLLDGLEYLVSVFGFDSVYKLLQEIRFEFLEHRSLLLVSAQIVAFSKMEQALLMSELKVFENAVKA